MCGPRAEKLVQVGRKLVDVSAICGASYEKSGKLYVYFYGGQFIGISQPEASRVWEMLLGRSVDLDGVKVQVSE